MECKHPYYHYVDGALVCVQCGAPSPKSSRIEDKIDNRHETKLAKPPVKKKAGRK